ncbi:unnamed protein product [Moneuplotes crassus]|uniref:Uncharacterized protein n=1 Tax=Euplotes crassus TaxID=5936 RepID=A0AAD2D9Q9_EUPCR|nr:unnamed protein product [Moneuplotes crassus]
MIKCSRILKASCKKSKLPKEGTNLSISLSKRAIIRRNLNFQIRERNKLKFKISSNSKKSLHKNSKSRIVNERSTPNLSNSKEIFEVISRLFINNYTTKVLRCFQRKNFVKDLLEQAPK